MSCTYGVDTLVGIYTACVTGGSGNRVPVWLVPDCWIAS